MHACMHDDTVKSLCGKMREATGSGVTKVLPACMTCMHDMHAHIHVQS